MYLIKFQNTATQTIAPNSAVNLGAIYRLFERENCKGSVFTLNADSITLKDIGMYDFDIILEISSATAGDVSLAIAENGVVIPFTEFTETISTATTEFRTISLKYTSLISSINKLCNKAIDIKSLSVVNTSDFDITITNVIGSVNKVVY